MIDPLRRALSSIAQDDRYRLWPAYSIVMLTMWWSLMRWPIDMHWLYALVEYPAFYEYYKLAHVGFLLVAISLGLAGLLRRAWPARLAAATGVYLGVQWLWEWQAWHWNPIEELLYFVLAGVWLAPIDWIAERSYGSEPLALFMYAAYLFVPLLALRKLVLWAAAALARKHRQRLAPLEAWLEARGPQLDRWGRHIL